MNVACYFPLLKILYYSVLNDIKHTVYTDELSLVIDYAGEIWVYVTSVGFLY